MKVKRIYRTWKKICIKCGRTYAVERKPALGYKGYRKSHGLCPSCLQEYHNEKKKQKKCSL